MDKRILQAANTAGFIVMVAVNALANILPLNDVTTAELNDSYPNYFVPAGHVFSIWGGHIPAAPGVHRLPGPPIPERQRAPRQDRLALRA